MLSYIQRFPNYISIICIISALAIACDNESNSNQTLDDMNLNTDLDQSDQSPEITDDGPNANDMMLDMETDLDTMLELDMITEELANLSLNSIVPNRGPISGGNEITIVGTGFSENAVFAIDRIRCTTIEIINTSRAKCQVPEGFAEGSVNITAYDEHLVDGMIEPQQAILESAYYYYVPLEVDQLVPSRGSSQSNTRVTIVGSGFTEETTVVSFGGIRASEVELLPNGTLSAIAPPHAVGYVDVTILNENGQVQLADAFYYYERLELLAISPAASSLDGGVEAILSGKGLRADSRVIFGGRAAQILGDESGQLLTVSVPRGAEIGAVDVSISNENGEVSLVQGFIYYDANQNNFDVIGITPQSGPVQGGDQITVAGSGFTDDTQVLIGTRPASCQRITNSTLNCTTPPSAPGEVGVTISQDGQDRISPMNYTYYQEIELTAVFPDRGSIAGGTLVELIGRGFEDGMEVTLGEQNLLDLVIVNNELARGVTASSSAGTVDVIAGNALTRGIIDAGFEYFDPSSQFGGVWGDDILNSMNVTVLNGGSGLPEPEVQVLLISQELLTLEGITDQSGQTTLSHPNLRAPANITAAKEGFEVTTLEDVEVENITIILNPQPEGMGSPPPGVPPATLEGTVRGLDLIPKPSTERYINIALVETTHTSPNNRQDLPPFGPGGILTEDGPFQIISRLGELAVIATVGQIERVRLTSYENGEIDYWTMRDSFSPISMGVRRYVSARSGEVSSDLHIEVDHPLDLESPIDFDNPPYEPGAGPSYYAILPSLNFSAEGFFELDTQAFELDPNLTLRDIPRLNNWGSDVAYYLINFAFTPSNNNTPMSINILEIPDLTQGTLVTPFAPAAILESPLEGGQLGDDRILRWRLTDGYDGPISAPSATVIEIAEPGLAGPVPLWRYVVPPNVTSVEFPVLSSAAGETGLNGGFMLLNVLPFIAEGRFNYDDFTYLDINGSRWISYGITSSDFLE